MVDGAEDAGRRPRRRRKAPTARSVAAHVLLRVDRDQAFASAALDAELDRADGVDRDDGEADPAQAEPESLS